MSEKKFAWLLNDAKVEKNDTKWSPRCLLW